MGLVEGDEKGMTEGATQGSDKGTRLGDDNGRLLSRESIYPPLRVRPNDKYMYIRQPVTLALPAISRDILLHDVFLPGTA